MSASEATAIASARQAEVNRWRMYLKVADNDIQDDNSSNHATFNPTLDSKADRHSHDQNL